MNDIFSIKEFSFPDNFLWGSATAAHQIEGDNFYSDRWQVENRKKLENPDFEPSGKACNHYAMYKQDADILSELGHKAYRMSLEWARIEPEEGKFNDDALRHYIDELKYLKSKNIKIFLTLVHLSHPAWFAAKGGFADRRNMPYFVRYINFVVPEVAAYVDFWNVLNEINLGATKDRLDFKYESIFFHAVGYHEIKRYSSAPVSSAHALVQAFGKRQNDVFDKAVERYIDAVNNEFFFHAVRTGELVVLGKGSERDSVLKDTCDFWSINTYVRDILDSRKPDFYGERYPFLKMKMISEDFYLEEFNAECIIHNLSRLKDKPVIITENGCSADNDDYRIAFITEYLCALSEAIKDGVDVRGYLYWSLLDNYEWNSFDPKFGLVAVDRKGDFKRTIKPSAYFYKEIIQNNGFNPEMLKKYLTRTKP